MATDLTIKVMTNADKTFYPTVGPFLARRRVVADLGAPAWDDDDKTWFVALRQGRVIGFCAARDSGDTVTFQTAWVDDECRNGGVYAALFAARMNAYRDRRVRARCSDASVGMFLTHGFEQVRRVGRFTEVRRGA